MSGRASLDPLEESLGFSFGDKGLLRTALIHSSYLNENPDESSESNERMEFLGDGLLGLVIAQELYERYPEKPEGELTSLRSALVRGETLARVTRGMNLGDHLVMGKGEESNGGRQRSSNLAATFEAVVGAVFLDQGYEPARVFALNALAEELSDVSLSSRLKSPKSRLQELLQGQGLAPPTYRIAAESGHDHDRHFTVEAVSEGKVVGSGVGSRKSQAEQEAAAEALKALNEKA